MTQMLKERSNVTYLRNDHFNTSNKKISHTSFCYINYCIAKQSRYWWQNDHTIRLRGCNVVLCTQASMKTDTLHKLQNIPPTRTKLLTGRGNADTWNLCPYELQNKARKVQSLGPGVWKRHDHSAVRKKHSRMKFSISEFSINHESSVMHIYHKLHRTNIPPCSSNTSAEHTFTCNINHIQKLHRKNKVVGLTERH